MEKFLGLAILIVPPLLTVLVLVVGFKIIQRNQEKRQVAAEADYARGCMIKAMESRARLDIAVELPEDRKMMVNGVCMDVGDSHMLIAALLPQPGLVKKGEKVHVYFHVTHVRGTQNHDFEGVILDRMIYQGHSVIKLNIPRALGNNQKRLFMRVKPLDEALPTPFLWHIDPGVLSVGCPENLRKMGSAEVLRIKNISAAGIRMRLRGDSSFRAGDRVAIYLSMINLDKGEHKNIWLLGEVVMVNAMADVVMECGISIKFLYWSPDPQEGECFTWIEVRPKEGVPGFAPWLVYQQLKRRTVDDV